ASLGSSEWPLTPTSEAFGITSRTNAARSIYSVAMTPATVAEGGQSGAVTVNVQGSTETDRALTQQISEELRADASLASAISQVRISVTDGQVILRGVVRNDVQKREIESAIQRTTGVSSVDNQLRVSLTGSPDNL
ncbi:MAG: BON domain-containing protein, partial [Akkermansiaceae bacterium]|nr:BON domain-containing protein [Verrucomicrobiales bacterium]